MFDIEIRLQGSETFSEFPPEACCEMECAIEDIVGCALLQIFDSLTVIKVTVRCVPAGKIVASFSIHGA